MPELDLPIPPAVLDSATRQKGCLDPVRVAALIAYIDAHFAEPITVDDLARLCGLSRFHFARRVRRTTGESPHGYLIAKRLARARELLEGTALPISEIATQVGYRTQAHFTSLFSSKLGVTPGAYRRRHAAAKREPG